MICLICKIDKPLTEFYKNIRHIKNGGYDNRCKECFCCIMRNMSRKKYTLENGRIKYNKRKEKKGHIKNFYDMCAKYPEKYKARYELRNAIKLGKIIKKSCEICGEQKVEAHHPDYSKPLDVKWLCRKHHKELHRLS